MALPLARLFGLALALCAAGCSLVAGFRSEAAEAGVDAQAHDAASDTGGGYTVTETDAFCSGAGWCWQHPRPHGWDLLGLWVEEDDSLWVGGVGGLLARRRDGEWKQLHVGDSPYPNTAIWRLDDDELVVGGFDGAVYHQRGARWYADATGGPPIASFWSPPGTRELFAAAGGGGGGKDDGLGAVLHYDGDVWNTLKEFRGQPALGIWGRSATDVTVVGKHGLVQRFDGTAWESPLSPELAISLTAVDVSGVWCDANRTFVVAVDGTLVEQKVGGEALDYNLEGGALWSVWGDGEGQVFAAGQAGEIYQRLPDPDGWESMDTQTVSTLYRVHGNGERVFAVGAGGTVLRLEGESWIQVAPEGQQLGLKKALRAVWTPGVGQVWVGLGEQLWGAEADGAWGGRGSADVGEIHAIWGRGVTDAFIGGPLGIARYDGSSFALPDNEGPIDLIGGSSGETPAVFAAGAGQILKLDGGDWKQVVIFDEVVAFGGDPLHAVSYGLTAQGWELRSSAQDWAPILNSTAVELAGLWGAPGGPLWLVGHYKDADGTERTAVYRVVDGELVAEHTDLAGRTSWIAGTGAGELALVGADGQVHHFDGAQWSSKGFGPDLHAVTANGDEMYAVGDRGTVLVWRRPKP